VAVIAVRLLIVAEFSLIGTAVTGQPRFAPESA
jgi:hypothetical protein